MRAVLSAVVAALLFVAWVASDGEPGTGQGADEVVRIKREEQFCVPNTTFQMDCNECICEYDGLGASCTAMDCPDRRRRGCTHGERKKEDCNYCICTPKGDWLCTMETCSEHKTQTRCAPGTTFLRKCSRCVCDDDGETAACTRMCPSR